MKALISGSVFLALLAPALAHAQDRRAATGASDFSRLWTGWSSVNRQAMSTESAAAGRVREEIAAADAERLAQLRDRGRALGERVGEIVRLGDCAEGERVARAAGDFALVEAVRAHCGSADAPAE